MPHATADEAILLVALLVAANLPHETIRPCLTLCEGTMSTGTAFAAHP
jgi:hypothetical protein